MISLKPVNEMNFNDTISLSLHDYQQNYVVSVVYSIAQCYIYRDNNDVFPFLIEFNNKPIGFILLDEDLNKKELLIWRLIIDKHEQGKGYAKKIIKYVISLLKEINTYDYVTINSVEENEIMLSVINSLDFDYLGIDSYTKEKMFHYPL
ncbi:hypothetical protein BW731_07880 [Vagococcus martis]|uniref:N-acetyltransferase domain-containing protein n=1 Tax=Vagococcus martis TaxID=1768210 RepID=A0A1V4DI07_9ENTE|nr:GNAT family N-acetyltransferase [Vagococcus martis]OPF88093.1 hypothetical protein BW731_07880 [Vagococcus martis]